MNWREKGGSDEEGGFDRIGHDEEHTMRITKEDIPVRINVPGAVARLVVSDDLPLDPFTVLVRPADWAKCAGCLLWVGRATRAAIGRASGRSIMN